MAPHGEEEGTPMALGPRGEVGGVARGRQGGALGPAIGPVGARDQVPAPPRVSHVTIMCCACDVT